MFAAIYIPDFPVEAIVRAEPELREQAVAVVEGTPPLVHVIAVNEKAAQAGAEPGMTKLEAEERLGPNHGSKTGATQAGTIRQRSREREAAAHAALLDCACGFSPRVEDTAADTVVLDLAGLERIFGAPAKMARDVARRCSEMGLEANVAVAWNADTAVLAARGFAGVTMIAEGKEAERLGELSVEVLLDSKWSVANGQWPVNVAALKGERVPIYAEILDTLERWGVRNLRALAALPEVALAERLGQAGLRLQKLARGQTRRPLVIAEPPLVFEEAAELEYPLELLEPLAFLLNHMLEQLCTRLAARALATNEIKLRLQLEVAQDCGSAEARNCGIEHIADHAAIPQCGNSSIHQRTLRLPVPMLDAKVFLKLMQLDLQAHPPEAPVTKVWLRAEPAEPRRAQNGLFAPEAPEAERLELTIARINRVVDGGKAAIDQPTNENRQSTSGVRVGSPEILDTHRQDGFRMKPFAADEGARGSAHARQIECSPGEAPGPTSRKNAGALVALRVFRPALVAVVAMKDGQPAQVASPERPTMRGEVVWCAGPWRSSGEWWTEQAWSHEEWDVAVRNEEGVTVYRIYRDQIASKWWVEGTYD
jgi:protein ImuB